MRSISRFVARRTLHRRVRGGGLLGLLGLIVLVLAVLAIYTFIMLSWNYSSGERAGWLQKLSRKGWVCKTWEGELAMVSMPGSTPEKFYFTVRDEEVARRINRNMGKRVSLHYEEKAGLPGSCFGDTRYFVVDLTPVDDIPQLPGVSIPASQTPAVPAAK